MKILYVGNAQGFQNADKFYLTPQRVTNGLTRAGHNVYIFNDRDVARYHGWFKSSKFGRQSMNDRLIKTCKNFEPDLIVLAHCHHVTNKTLLDIRELLPDCKIIHRNVDPLDDAGNVERIKSRIGYVDGIFITTAGDILEQFTGPTTFAAFFPNPVDDSIDTGRSFENQNHEYDIFFAGGDLGPAHHRTKILSLLDRNFKNTSTRLGIFGGGINQHSLFGVNFINALSHSKSGLIINKSEDFYLYASDRMSQYLGNGLLVYAPETPRYTDLFTDSEIVTYATGDDLLEKIKYFEHHDDERKKIAENGYLKAHRIFDTTLVARYFIDMTFDRMENKTYPWPTRKYTGHGK